MTHPTIAADAAAARSRRIDATRAILRESLGCVADRPTDRPHDGLRSSTSAGRRAGGAARIVGGRACGAPERTAAAGLAVLRAPWPRRSERESERALPARLRVDDSFVARGEAPGPRSLPAAGPLRGATTPSARPLRGVGATPSARPLRAGDATAPRRRGPLRAGAERTAWPSKRTRPGTVASFSPRGSAASTTYDCALTMVPASTFRTRAAERRTSSRAKRDTFKRRCCV